MLLLSVFKQLRCISASLGFNFQLVWSCPTIIKTDTKKHTVPFSRVKNKLNGSLHTITPIVCLIRDSFLTKTNLPTKEQTETAHFVFESKLRALLFEGLLFAQLVSGLFAGHVCIYSRSDLISTSTPAFLIRVCVCVPVHLCKKKYHCTHPNDICLHPDNCCWFLHGTGARTHTHTHTKSYMVEIRANYTFSMITLAKTSRDIKCKLLHHVNHAARASVYEFSEPARNKIKRIKKWRTDGETEEARLT